MEQLKKSIKYLYGLPSFGFQLFVNMEIFYFSAFMTDYAKIPAAIAGTVLMITSIFDMVWVPTAGVILEKSNLKWGRYRSWLLIGPPLAALFFIFQFSNIGTPMVNAAIISVGFIVSHLIWNIFYAGHLAMNSSMTKVNEERISLASNRGMFNALGALLFSAIGLPIIMYLGKQTNPAMGYTLMVVITGIVMIACYYTLFFMTKNYAFHPDEDQEAKERNKMSIGEMLKQIIVNPPLIGLMLGEVGRYLGRFIIFGLAFYYFKYVVNNIVVLSIFFTGLNVVSFSGAAISNFLGKKIGTRRTYILSMVIFIVGLLAVWALPMNYISFMVIMFLAYLGYGIPDAMGVAMYSATVDYGEWKTGKNARGFIMSLISFPIKTAVLLRGVIITAVLVSADYVANMEATPELISAIKAGIALVPGLFLTASLIIIAWLYRITPEKLDKMQAEIAARKSKADDE